MTQEERARLTKEKILNAAMNEFSSRGYEGGTIGDICRTGINKGLIYHYFSGKDDLYLTCMKISADAFVSYLEKERPAFTDQDAEKMISRYMSTRVRFFEDYPEESRIFFEGLMAPPEELKEEISAILKPFTDLSREINQEAFSHIRLKKDITPEMASQAFTLTQAMFNSYFGSPAMQGKSIDSRIELHEKTIPELLSIILYGIAES
ncbi:MAG: TetR/AcrR family transcriptional regulator [Oscillospiraceae bacterium]|jgi:AcrR family transcriptional regulator